MVPLTDSWENVQQAVAAIRKGTPGPPSVGLILGSGLGGIADRITDGTPLEYTAIPHFPRPTAAGHRGRLVCGLLRGQAVIVMQGRMHLYEGYSPAQIALPIRTFHALGVQTLIVTNAAGGLNSSYRRSEVMLIDDHINLMFANPLVGPNDDRWGTRFPDMSSPYDPRLIELAQVISRRHGLIVHQGVYAGVRGPTYETRAEYRMLRWLGADVVGMSTVPEVIAAVHCGMRVLGMSIVTNVASPDALPATTHQDVVDAADVASPALASLIEELVSETRHVSMDGSL